jgi:hypothetical protein
MASVRHLGFFPWCVPRSIPELVVYATNRSGIDYGFLNDLPPPAAGSLWPISLSREKAMDLYWRVKTLKISAPLETVFETGQIITDAANEKDLVCLPLWPNVTSLQAYSEARGGIDQGFLTISWDFLLYDESIDKYHIPLYADFTQYNGEELTDSYSNTSYGQNSGAVLGGYIDFLGEQLPMGAYILGEPVIPYAAGTISVEEWWPYDPNDGGGPIYNSATGAQLRAFPTN